jgi:hypothetical protein
MRRGRAARRVQRFQSRGRGSYSVGARCRGIREGGVQQGMSSWREGTSSERSKGEGSRDEEAWREHLEKIENSEFAVLRILS